MRTKSSEQIISELMQNYSSFIKPRRNISESVDVNLTLHITSLREIDERLQTMTFIGWMEISWIDDFLILKDGVKSVQLPTSDIWHPDIALFNSIDDPQQITDGQYVVVLEEGRVVWYPARQYSVRCIIDIRRFPFDEQKCQIRIGAWQAPVWVQRVVDTGRSLADNALEENGEWEVIERIAHTRFSSEFSISYMEYDLHFRRRCLYPVLNTLFPVILLSFLNPLVFLLPADSGEKMTLCISVLLSFTVFLTVFNDMLPKLSTGISYLSIYLCIELGMSGLAVVESIFILRLYQRDNKTSSKSNHEPSKQTSISTLEEDVAISNIRTLAHNNSTGIYESQSSSVNDKRENGHDVHTKGNFVRNSFKMIYRLDADGKITTLAPDRLDWICFLIHLCITSVCTLILILMLSF
ncbi:neuronal acetylcholine receptor subunit alpha-6-like [Argopecten irradians]|uniref:neuronal acetylcholine receptor subunit alpha-6-like n=1 Tax=Argopecten irradians TaxID=31199 RepID=UPI00370FC44A